MQFFEHGTCQQRHDLASQLVGHVLVSHLVVFLNFFSMNPKLGVGIYMPPSLSFFSSQSLVKGVKACLPVCIIFVCNLFSSD